jgi:large subunit ribosomal protein L18
MLPEGLLLGKKALEKDVKAAVLYVGKDKFTPRVAAALKGVVDSGVNIPVSQESLPPAERLTGKHIAEYASSLKANNLEYNSRFSGLLKAGLNPEDYPSHFEEVRLKISGKPSEFKLNTDKESRQKADKSSKEKPAKEGRPREKTVKPDKKKEAKTK